MAAPESSDDLIKLIDRSGLLPADTIRQKLNGNTITQAAGPLAEYLVKIGLLTNFQAEQILQGKAKGFFLGNYRVLERLGGGGTANVFLCEHRIMKHRVAIKVLDPEMADDPNNLAAFAAKPRAAAGLCHPNIVRTIDLDTNGDWHFLVMEYVDGMTLSEWQAHNPNASQRVFASIILQAAKGLKCIHESGLIHRDLKHSNLLITKQGTVKILDLGLAKFTEDKNDGLTRIQGASIVGTIDFMSPEQADGDESLDIRADIYSLGVTLYSMLSGGKPPFPQTTFASKMIAIQTQMPKPLAQHRPNVDPGLARIVERMMEKDRNDRYQTPQELMEALDGWIKSSPKSASRTGNSGAEAPRKIKSEPRADETDEVEPARRSEIRQISATARRPVQSKPGRRKASRSVKSAATWSLSSAAVVLIIGGLLLWKPWRSSPKDESQMAVAVQPTSTDFHEPRRADRVKTAPAPPVDPARVAKTPAALPASNT